MRLDTILCCTVPIAATQAQLLPLLTRFVSPLRLEPQHPMGSTPGIQLPPADPADNSLPTSGVRLSDVIGNQRTINLFAGFTRDVESVARRLDDSTKNTTVLAPINNAVTSLPRKPWEDPKDYDTLGASAYSGQDGQDRASGNLRRFTESHLVGVSPWKAGEKVKTLGGNEVWWEEKKGKAFVQPGNIEIEGVVKRAANGEVWALRGVLNYAE